MKLKLKNSVAAVIIIIIFAIFSQSTFAQVALDFSSYLGGSVSETIKDIAVDETGATYVMGYTSSFNFPITNAFQPTIGNPGNNYFDIFITKIAPDGTSIVFSTFLGGWVTNFLVENFLLESSWTNSLALAMSPSGAETQLVYSVGTNNMSQIIFPPVILNVKNYFVSYPAEIYISNLYHVYDGTTKEADVTTSPTGLIVDVTYNGSAVLPIAAGDYAVMAIVNEVYYHRTNTAILKIVYPYPFIDITNIDHTVAYNISFDKNVCSAYFR